MAHEVDLAGRHLLPETGKKVCACLGYQRFAMMIVGSMITKGTGAGKQKKRKTWDEVFVFVKSVRDDVGISNGFAC